MTLTTFEELLDSKILSAPEIIGDLVNYHRKRKADSSSVLTPFLSN